MPAAFALCSGVQEQNRGHFQLDRVVQCAGYRFLQQCLTLKEFGFGVAGISLEMLFIYICGSVLVCCLCNRALVDPVCDKDVCLSLHTDDYYFLVCLVCRT